MRGKRKREGRWGREEEGKQKGKRRGRGNEIRRGERRG